MKEAELISNAKGGDKAAFSALVKMHKAYLFAVVFQLLKSKEDAEDVLQNAFIKIYQKLYTFKNQAKFSSWIYRIAINEALTYRRLFRLKLEREQKMEEPVQEKNSLDKIIQDDLKKEVQLALEQLTESEQMVIQLYYYKGQKVGEVAYICNKSISWVKVVLHRARKKLENIIRNNKNLIYEGK